MAWRLLSKYLREKERIKLKKIIYQCPHCLIQISEYSHITLIQAFTRKIAQNPWKNGVLCNILKAPACQRIQLHQILKITYLSSKPFFNYSWLFNKFFRIKCCLIFQIEAFCFSESDQFLTHLFIVIIWKIQENWIPINEKYF